LKFRVSIYWCQFAAAMAVVGGFALLPGGLTVAMIGIIASLGLYLSRHAHRIMQSSRLAPQDVPPLPAPPRGYRRAMRIALLLILFTHLDVPLMITVHLVKISALSDWRYEPSTEFPRHFTFVGCTLASCETVGPDGVTVSVLGGGEMKFLYVASADALRPLPYSRWNLYFLHGVTRYYESQTYSF
jgi:hypothetical protein